MAFNYQEMAKTELSRHGITPDSLTESHPNQLKRLALEYDMGEVSFQSPVASQLAENAPGDNAGRMKAFSEALVEEATFSFPPKADYFGVDVTGKLNDSILSALKENKDIKNLDEIPKDHLDSLFGAKNEGASHGEVSAIEVIKSNPNLMPEMFAEGFLDEKNPTHIKAASESLIESFNPDTSGVVSGRFSGEIEELPASVWSEEALKSYAGDTLFASSFLERYERHTGNEVSNETKAEFLLNDTLSLDAECFKEIREAAANEIIRNPDYSGDFEEFCESIYSEEIFVDVRDALDDENEMMPYAEAFLTEGLDRDSLMELVHNTAIELDASKRRQAIDDIDHGGEEAPGRLDDFVAKMEDQDKQIQLVANGNEEAFQVHEQLKSGELQLGDMSAEQKTLLNDINWQTTVSETFEGQPFEDAQRQAMPGDSDWMSSMERNATVEMESPGGLKLEFGIQTEPSTTYDSVDTLREFYDCQVGVDPEAPAMVNDKPVSPSEMYELSDELRDHWEGAALQEVGQLPVEYEAIADRTFADLAIDNTLSVSRDNLDEIAISFSVEDPYRDGGVEFTMKAGDPDSLTFVGQEPSEAGMSIAETYVAENQEMLAAEIDSFKLQEVGLSNVELDYELIEGAQAHFVTLNNQGEPSSVGLDSETLKLDSNSPGYDKLSEAQVEVLSEQVGKLTDGMTPPMGLEMAERKAEELSDLTGNKVYVMDYSDDANSDETGYSVHEIIDVGEDSVRGNLVGSYESAAEMNRDLDIKISEAREGLSIERDEPKQEVERERHEEEPERRGIRM